MRLTLISRSIWPVLALLVAGCAGCASDRAAAPATKALELNIVHLNDHHSQLDAMPSELTLEGVATQVELGGLARQAALFKSLAGSKNLLKIHAGDALTGTQYYTLFKSAADATLMNNICFDAFVPGNHEFDDGDAALKVFLAELANSRCHTAVLSANVVAAAGSPLAPDGGPAKLKRYLIKDFDGVKVGLVGITVSGKTRNSSRPLASTRFNDETISAQQTIDELKAQGVRHIVVVTHQGYQADQALAAQLSDVDVIIGGDSHTLLGDFSGVGLASAGDYPTVALNKSGETVCIGQAWEYGKATGLMNVRFDESGVVTRCGGQATLLIGDSFRRKDKGGAWQPVADDDRQALIAKLAATPGAITVLDPDQATAATLKTYSDRVAGEKEKIFGRAGEALCLVRVPGESSQRSAGIAGCAAANTLARGSDAAQVVAEAFLYAARRADFALQNGGGVRVAVSAGALSMNTAFTLLPFANVLVELELSGAETVAALEDAVDHHLAGGSGGSGAHPYAAGLRWDLDMSQAKGQRFSQVEVRDRKNGGWAAIDPTKTYTLVTSDFLAAGKDGYTTLGAVSRSGRAINTQLLYTQSFVDYVQNRGHLSRPPRNDYSHQAVVTQAGVRLP